MSQSPSSAIVFDDAGGQLGPLTDLRASFEVRTGALTTGERLRRTLRTAKVAVAGFWVPSALAAMVRERSGIPCNDSTAIGGSGVLLVNGRCVLLPEKWNELALGHAMTCGTSVLVAHLSADQARAFLEIGELPKGITQNPIRDAALLERPWDVIRHRDRALDADLAMLASELPALAGTPGVTIIGGGVRAAKGVRVFPGAILDSEGGTIVLDEGAIVRPGAIICGPAYIGRGSTVLERAHIKAHTAIGPVCKVNGEIGGTIFQGYANKGHDGHLGDSWVGEWANFGAGTTNSNLLNTYGEVTATVALGMSRERTGLIFLGAIVGDHVKLAIMTRIMTGTVFGTGSMIAQASPPTLVGRFEWITDGRRQPYRLDRFMAVARAAMGRRKVEPSAAYVGAIEELHNRGGSGRGS